MEKGVLVQKSLEIVTFERRRDELLISLSLLYKARGGKETVISNGQTSIFQVCCVLACGCGEVGYRRRVETRGERKFSELLVVKSVRRIL